MIEQGLRGLKFKSSAEAFQEKNCPQLFAWGQCHRAVAAEDILYLSFALNKPILYFSPKEYTDEMGEISEDDLTPDEREFLVIIQQLKRSDLRKLMAQARALVEYKE